MKKLASFAYLCLLFFLLSLQSAMAQRRPPCGPTPKMPACATPVCQEHTWVPVPKSRGIGCRDTKGAAGFCDGVNIDCAQPCPDQTAFVAPKYYVLSLIYSPPGCTSTSSYKC